LTLRAKNPRPTLVLLDPKAKIMLTSTTQISGPSITPKSRPIETGLITSKEIIKIQGNKHLSRASKSHTLKDVLEARRGGGVEKGLAMDGEWRNKHREDQQNCKN
jgi:hypothetical protein